MLSLHTPQQQPKAIVILGNGLIHNNGKTELPDHVQKRLDIVTQMYHEASEENRPLLVTTGKWSLWYRRDKNIPSITEADAMGEYLRSHGIPEDAILSETESEDTIGNAFFLKRLLQDTPIRHLTVLCADFHEERATYIFNEVLGKEFTINFISTPGPYEGKELEEQTIHNRNLLENVQKPFIQKLLNNPALVENLYDQHEYRKQLENPPDEVGIAAMGTNGFSMRK